MLPTTFHILCQIIYSAIKWRQTRQRERDINRKKGRDLFFFPEEHAPVPSSPDKFVKYLSEVVAGRFLIEAVFVPHDVIVQVAAISQFQNEVKLRLRIDDFVKTDDVGMLDQFHAAHLLEKMRSRHFVQFGFVDNFYGDFFSRKNVTRQFDHGEMPPTYLRKCFSLGEAAQVKMGRAYRGFLPGHKVQQFCHRSSHWIGGSRNYCVGYGQPKPVRIPPVWAPLSFAWSIWRRLERRLIRTRHFFSLHRLLVTFSWSAQIKGVLRRRRSHSPSASDNISPPFCHWPYSDPMTTRRAKKTIICKEKESLSIRSAVTIWPKRREQVKRIDIGSVGFHPINQAARNAHRILLLFCFLPKVADIIHQWLGEQKRNYDHFFPFEMIDVVSLLINLMYEEQYVSCHCSWLPY